MSVLGLNNEPPRCTGAGLRFTEAVALYSKVVFYASFKRVRYFSPLLKLLDIKKVGISRALI